MEQVSGQYVSHGILNGLQKRYAKPLSYWLFACAAMVVLMVIIGGLTRLTNSGLSMTDWHPIHDAIPPLNETEWQEEFLRYQQYPEYQKINKGMDISSFKRIFYFEYVHRIAGRVTGFVFLLPFLYFLFKRAIPLRLGIGLFGIFLLGGLQGLIGWYMVKSGLVDRPDVSHYRLTLHLSTAILLFCVITNLAFKIYYQHCPLPQQECELKPLRRFALFLVIMIFLQIMLGGLVAGLNAGLIYNTFPKMGEEWVPSDLLYLQPWYKNFLEHVPAVQFLHRWFAMLVLVTGLVFAFHLRRKPVDARLKTPAAAILFLLLAQFTLGVLTLLMQVPVMLASMHQVVAVLLIGSAIWCYQSLRSAEIND